MTGHCFTFASSSFSGLFFAALPFCFNSCLTSKFADYDFPCVGSDSDSLLTLSLARQMTMEDEEEVERERRRRVKSSTSPADPEAPRDTPTSDSPFGTDSTSETSQGLSRLLPHLNETEFIDVDYLEVDL